MKFPVYFARVAAVIGTAAALGSALMFGAAAAQASSNESARTAATGPVGDPTARVERVFVIQPDGTSVEVPPGTDLGAAIAPYYRWRFGSTVADCNAFEMCLWSANHFEGVGLFMGGDLARCAGFRFEGTFMQDHVYSIWNRVAGGPVSIWNRFSDGSYNYHKFALLPPNYYHSTEFSKIMDAWVFDPANNCTHLHLYQVPQPS